MNHRDQQFIAELKPKQQALDFFAEPVWQQLAQSQRSACSLAVAELIFQVTQAKRNQQPTSPQSEQEDE